MAVIENTNGRERDRSDLLLWIFVSSELAAFGLLLAGFLAASLVHAEAFSAARLQLDGRLASVCTLVMITSGWLAAEAMRASSPVMRRAALVAAALLGLAFSAIRLWEYRGQAGYAADDADYPFFQLYHLITGAHLAQVVLLALAMLWLARRPVSYGLSIVATVWQVLGLVWLVLFPVLYLG